MTMRPVFWGISASIEGPSREGRGGRHRLLLQSKGQVRGSGGHIQERNNARSEHQGPMRWRRWRWGSRRGLPRPVRDFGDVFFFIGSCHDLQLGAQGPCRQRRKRLSVSALRQAMSPRALSTPASSRKWSTVASPSIMRMPGGAPGAPRTYPGPGPAQRRTLRP